MLHDERKRVLVVDDDPDMCALYSEWLSDAGFAVETATDGASAVALATAQALDVIVMDLQMPELDGYEAAQLIRASIAGRGPYILALTGYTGPESRGAAHRSGCDDVLEKPLAPEALVSIIREVLRELTGRLPVTDPDV